jgi:hypothetical protein
MQSRKHYVFDGIFNRDDVLRIAAVDLVHQRRHGGRLSRPGRAPDQTQPVMKACELLDL